jgi:hypothetical protein
MAPRRILLPALFAFLWLFPPARAFSTELWIQPRDEAGRLLRLSRAEVYLDIWGHGQNVALAQSERGVKLPLDRSWPCEAWPEICDKNALWGARLILQAEGYAVVTSRTFAPFGTAGPHIPLAGTSGDTVTIEFEGIPAVRVKEGETKEITVPFRRPAPRVLRIVDEQGKRLAGIDIMDRLIFAQSNHCGAVEGETLIQGVTDASGEMKIPDAGGECAFEMDPRHYALQESAIAEVPIVAIRQLRAPVTIVVLRALEKKSLLQLEFTNGGTPAAGLQLMSCRDHCCGACCGTIEGETDNNGRVLLKDYYPDEIVLHLRDRSDKVYWQGAVPRPDKSGVARIDIQKK